ncbi:MAG: hypothetical protein PVI21_06140 [Candidatus Woesebacteria bacterium]
MSLISWLETGQEDPRVPFEYREFQKLLHGSGITTQSSLFAEYSAAETSDTYGIGQWCNIGDRVRGEFFSFGLITSEAKNPTPASVNSLRRR